MAAIPGVSRTALSETRFELRLRVQILASLYAAGATLVLLTLVLPHDPRAHAAGLLASSAIAYVAGGLLWWRADRLGRWTPFAALAFGSTLVASVAYWSGETPSPLIFFFLWVFLYSAYFFTAAEAALQIAYVGALYGSLLLAHPPDSSTASWWLVGMGTATVAAAVIRVMRDRLELLIDRLSDAARTDALTLLPNRRGFRELLDLELERARRGETAMAVVVGDVDHFKDVNDRSGHHVGDTVLQRVGRVLRDGVRKIDVAARVGGEEFALVLPGTDAAAALVVAERLRGAIREAFARDAVPITMSFGIACYPEHAETAASLLRASDEALYAAKDTGRNRTVVHGPELRALLHDARDERGVAGDRFLGVVLELAAAVDVRFSGSARHSETVARYAEMMARELGLSEQRVGRVRLAGLLHDIGKVGVPDVILRKAGPLTEDERATIRRHPELGAQLLEHPRLADVQAWVRAHHERPDGLGYPDGLAGEQLPLEARIIAVADAYEAMTSDRAYRDAVGHAAARQELKRCAGTQFDPRVVAALLTALARESERAEALLAGV